MANQPIEITGEINLRNGSILPEFRVELWDSAPKGFGWLASVQTDINGAFFIRLNDQVSNNIDSGKITLSYKVYKDNILLIEDAVPDPQIPVDITIDDNLLDNTILDTTDREEIASYINITGTILDVNKIQLLDEVLISAYEKGFREKYLLTTTRSENGKFNIKLNSKSITNTDVIANRNVYFEVSDLSNSKILGISDSILLTSEQVNIQITTREANSKSLFDATVQSIKYVIGNTEIESLTIAEDKNDEVNYVAMTSANGRDIILNIVYAYQMAADTTIAPAFFFALLASGIGSNEQIYIMSASSLKSAINDAIQRNTIRAYDEEDIDSFIDELQQIQIEKAKSLNILKEEFVLNDVIYAIFGSQEDTNAFLKLYAQEFETRSDFWQEYEAQFGASLSDLAQLGLKLAAITSFQPAIISAIISDLGTDNITTLGSWDLNTWKSLVSDVCTDTNKLYVPAIIRGDATDPEDTYIQGLYAERLMGICQSMYPMAYVLNQLNGDEGSSLIPDEDIRAEVIAFLQRYPEFDPRITTVNDINATDYDLSGITNDPATLISGLAPFQRVLRIVGGNPVACCTLIIDGVSSAYAVSNMSPEQFAESYGYLFPVINNTNNQDSISEFSEELDATYLRGLVPIQEIVYSTASTIASVTKSSLLNAVTGAIGSLTLPSDNKQQTGQDIVEAESALSKGAMPAYSLTSSATAFTIPVIPPIFPGGYLPDPKDVPELSQLFGNLDYCACCDCMSLYSPAAYLTDTIHFLQQSGVNYYNALKLKRPDLVNIDLTCNNSDTPMPYIDLVIELLEIQILRATNPAYLPGTINNFSFQTSGTADQLAAYPEHVYKLIPPPTPPPTNYLDYTAFTVGTSPVITPYDEIYNSTNLAGAIYPSILPYNLAIDESRTYLDHFGISRLGLMELFLPFNQVPVTVGSLPPTNKITNFALYAEWLGLSQFAAIIVTGAYAYVTTNPWSFYGAAASTLTPATGFPDPLGGGGTIPSTGSMNWIDALCSRVDVLLQQTGISYDELLQYLTTSYINPHISSGPRQAFITNVTGEPADTCQLNKLKILFADYLVNPSPSTSAYSAAFFNRLHRFIRLQKAAQYSIYQWDILLRSMNITSINNDNFQQIGKLLFIADKLKIKPEIISMWFANADTVSYINYPENSVDELPSIYDLIFSNKSVVNNASTNYFSTPSSLSSITYTGFTGQIANFAGIQEDEVIALLNFLQISLSSSVSLNILSRVYVIAQITKAKKISIADFITFVGLCTPNDPTPPISPLPVALIIPYDLTAWQTAGGSLDDYLNNLQYMIDNIEAVQSSKFNVPEINYLIANQNTQAIGPSNSAIQLFYESIRTELQKNDLFPSLTIPDDVLLDKLKGIIFQHFSKEFNISLQIVGDIFSVADDSTAPINNQFVRYLLNNDFVKSTYNITPENIDFIDGLTFGDPIPIPPSAPGSDDYVPDFKLNLLYNWYKYCSKVTFISSRLKLRTKEFEYLYLPQPTATTGFDFAQLPVCFLTSPASLGTYAGLPVTVELKDAFAGILRISRAVDIANAWSFNEDGLGKLIDAVSGIIRPTTPSGSVIVVGPTDFANINVCFTNLLTLINNDTWGDMLYELIGNHVPNTGYTQYDIPVPAVDGLLDTFFTMTSSSNYSATSYQNLTNFLNIADLLYWTRRIGLTPTTLQATLVEDINLEDSRNVIVAAKGKYDDKAWAQIAKPLRDKIRTRQRDALVAYVRLTSNDLFQDLLIDVQMDACMTTSRIKQAISSVQLFVDRMLLGLEYYAGVPLVMTPSMITKWQSWRKWYGVWEANRKIFFYPEDWLEPELRDDKSIFFKEMEDELKQNDVTIDKVQESMLGYLRKLDDVSKLEPVGSCFNAATGETHVFSRSHGKSQQYYHRVLRTGNSWTAWDRVDIEIPSNHITPYVWNNKLYIFWLTFTVKKVPAPASIALVRDPGHLTTPNYVQDLKNSAYFYNTQDEVVIDDNGSTGNPTTAKLYYQQIDITLNWTEFKDGAWQKQTLSKNKMMLKISPWVQDQIFNYMMHGTSGYTAPVPSSSLAHYPVPTVPTVPSLEQTKLLNYLFSDRMENVTEYIISRINITPYNAVPQKVRNYDPYGPLFITPPTYINSNNNAAVVLGDLYLLINFPGYLKVWTPETAWVKDETTYHKCFHMYGSNSVEVPNNLLFYYQNTPPETLYHKNGAMISYPNTKYTSGTKFPGYITSSSLSTTMYNYDLEGVASPVYLRTMPDNFAILNQIIAPGYKIFPKSEYAVSAVDDHFMFEDGTNTYFVRYLPTLPATNPYYLADLNSAATASGGFYVQARTAGGFGLKSTNTSTNTQVGLGSRSVYPSATSAGARTGVPALDNTDPSNPDGWTGVITRRVSVNEEYPTEIGIGSTAIPTANKIVPAGFQDGRYLFQTFYHPHVPDFIRTLNKYGIDGLMRPDLLIPAQIVQTFSNTMNFPGVYLPTSVVRNDYPDNTVDFTVRGTYSIYNWELFFHLPMLMAQRMSENQKFFDAQKWYHYIFDPTSNTYMAPVTPTPPPTAIPDTRKYWKFLPFFIAAGGTTGVPTITTLPQLLALIHANDLNALTQVSNSENDPFQPYAIARLRTVSFMKNVLMKYLDNLIAWGDNLFTQDTIESINEATNLYILASNILGKRPVDVPQRVKTAKYSYAQLSALPSPGIDAIGEATVPIETYIDPGPVSVPGSAGSTTGITTSYFCLPPNGKLLTYWDIVEDRLFKIRHCQNIDGVAQQLPLFEPPIDPAILVRAAALGVDINSVLNDISGVNLPNYRFTYMVQKANEFCNDVKALGNALLSALEKKDGEDLALLRSGQEINVQKAILIIKQLQITEAKTNIDALDRQTAIVQARYDYYSTRTFMNESEDNYFRSMTSSIDLQKTQAVIQGIGSILAYIPNFSLQMWAAVGPTFGGSNLASAAQSMAGVIGAQAGILNVLGSMASTKGGFERRMDDWKFQANSAQLELAQLEKQKVALEIRLQMAQQDLDNQKLLIDNATSVDSFMRSKYTNSALYDWMKGQISNTYFQAYQLAYNLAKKAQQCYINELPLSTLINDGGFIQPTSWDSLKKGLLAGDMLQYDIRNMENAYISDNSRTLELTKHVSLALLNPVELIRLKATGTCEINIPEELYDLDYPGHINRIIKSVSISIPCVAGPYATIPCTLSHTGSYVRKDSSGTADSLRAVHSLPCSTITTSSAQNDNGMFDFNFRDERYLPFEGAGAISQWNISLVNSVSAPSMAIRAFDFNTISDVILHVKYTAINGSGTYPSDRAEQVSTDIQNAVLGQYPPGSGGSPIELPRYFSLKHEYPNEWYKFINDIATGVTSPSLDVVIGLNRFPFFAQGRRVVITRLGYAKRLKTGGTFTFDLSTTGYPAADVPVECTTVAVSAPLPEITAEAPYEMDMAITSFMDPSLNTFDANVDDIYMVVTYKVIP